MENQAAQEESLIVAQLQQKFKIFHILQRGQSPESLKFQAESIPKGVPFVQREDNQPGKLQNPIKVLLHHTKKRPFLQLRKIDPTITTVNLQPLVSSLWKYSEGPRQH